MKIALAADHTGFEQLKELTIYLESIGYQVQNFGPKSFKSDDDYPDFILPAAKSVASGNCDYGIILGGDGEGEAMVANKLKGVRCAVIYGPAIAKGTVDASGRLSHNHYEIARLTRLHNDANMLSLAARFLTIKDMQHIIKLWLGIAFSKEERHQRRIAKLDKLGS